jgi:hypothetical protein
MKCVTCGDELHPERAEKYNYCTKPACQEQNVKGVTIVAVAVNKAADHYQVVDDRTERKLASGGYVQEMATGPGRGQGSTPAEKAEAREARRPAGPRTARAGAGQAPARAGTRPADRREKQPDAGKPPATARSERPAPRAKPQRRAWTDSQEKLALIYHEQGTRPDEIARRLGLSTSVVIRMILAGRNRARP